MIPSSSPLVRMVGVSKRRRGAGAGFRLVVPQLVVYPGEMIMVRGPSGCGKSTLLDLMAMAIEPDEAARFILAPPDQAEIEVAALWRGRNRNRLGHLRASLFGYVLQTGGLLPYLSVRDNIELPGRILRRLDRALIGELTGRLGIQHLMGRAPATLSVGERQRVAIARALAHRPPIVLADEPTAALDPVNAQHTIDLLLDLAESQGIAVVMASHDSLETHRAVTMTQRLERQGGETLASFERMDAA